MPPVVPPPANGARHSAVLIPLFEEDGEAWMVLTRRAQHLRRHRGEVSFPGGRQDAGEALVDTALRETWEEIGVVPADVEVVGQLDHLTTSTTEAVIVPFVGILPGRPVEFRPNPDEVELVLTVPVGDLLAEGIFREERWTRAEVERPVYFFEVVGDTIWGATARILHGLLVRILEEQSSDRDVSDSP